MTFIVVGDVSPEDVLPAAKTWLIGIKPRAVARLPQRVGLRPTTRPQAFVHTDPEQQTASVSFTNLGPGDTAIKTAEQFRRDVLRAVAAGVVNRRFGNALASGDSPLLDVV